MFYRDHINILQRLYMLTLTVMFAQNAGVVSFESTLRKQPQTMPAWTVTQNKAFIVMSLFVNCVFATNLEIALLTCQSVNMSQKILLSDGQFERRESWQRILVHGNIYEGMNSTCHLQELCKEPSGVMQKFIFITL